MEVGIKDSNQPPVKAEEEALKRNTDCVYFLASPLTCKKGSECEYRHSEYARVNPRDCWFWLNGNCLNPKCAFRHPPLEGLLGTPTATSEGPSLTTSKSAALAQPTAANTSAYASSKQPVPCIYFQKGHCLKGDRCSFVHGTPPISNPTKQIPAPKVAKSFTELQTLTKGLGDLQKCNEKQKIVQVNTIKSEKVPPPLKSAMQAEIALPNNGAVKKSIFPPPLSNNELPRYKSTNIPQVMSGNSVIMPLQIHQAQTVDDYSFQNGKEAGEFLGESSPGFDVLVDDELEDSDYYHNEDEFGRGSGHEGIHMNSMNEFNHREPYNDSVDYDKYSRAWEPRRASSERILERESIPEKREFLRGRSPDRINESDLRHRLSKQRRVSGSRSTVSPNNHGDLYRREERDWHGEEKRFRGYSERSSGSGSHHLPSHGNRLQGRIKLPDRFSPDNDRNGFRNRPRLSPSKPPISSHQERHKDRLKQRVQEELIPEGRNFKGQFMRNYDVNFNTTTDFSGPKSLAELKSAKVSENSEDQSVNLLREQKNTRNPKIVGHQESEGDLSFEGPKPLSMILKRKREAVGSGSGTDSGNGRERNQKESERNLTGRSRTDLQRIFPSGSKEETNHYTPTHMTEPSYDIGDAGKMVEEEKGQVSREEDDSSYIQKEGDIETEDGLIIGNGAMEDQEFETFEQGDEEYDYEHEDDAELKIEEDENADPDEEYFDDEDGDDFAKRIGVMVSYQ